MKKKRWGETKCKQCRRIASETLDPPVANPWPQEPERLQPAPTPQRERDVRPDEHSACIAAVRAVAETLSKFSEEGFGHLPRNGQRKPTPPAPNDIVYRALRRLGRIADQELVGVDTFKKASHCGGVKPDGMFLHGWLDSPNCADAGNQIYGGVVEKIITHCKLYLPHVNSTDRERSQFIEGLGTEKKADCIEAALAAADYAWKMDNNEDMTWATLEGGAYAKGDIPT